MSVESFGMKLVCLNRQCRRLIKQDLLGKMHAALDMILMFTYILVQGHTYVERKLYLYLFYKNSLYIYA